MRLKGLAVGIITTLLAMIGSTSGSNVAAADGAVPLGGGAGITVNGTPCTLTTIGRDSAGNLVGFTSAHCGGPAASVAAEGAGGAVGSVVAADDGLDYAVIKFDPAKVTPIHDFDGFAINGIGPDLTQIELQTACQQSRATGHACAQIFAGRSKQTLYECGNPDDAGAPLTVNDALVGMIRGGFTPTDRPCPEIQGIVAPHPYFPKEDQPQIVSFDTILANVNAKGGPGAGFSLIPA
jgi:hypothetical protein